MVCGCFCSITGWAARFMLGGCVCVCVCVPAHTYFVIASAVRKKAFLQGIVVYVEKNPNVKRNVYTRKQISCREREELLLNQYFILNWVSFDVEEKKVVKINDSGRRKWKSKTPAIRICILSMKNCCYV